MIYNYWLEYERIYYFYNQFEINYYDEVSCKLYKVWEITE